MKKTLKEIFEQYEIYNDEGQLVPLMESDLGKELFGEVNGLNKSDVSDNGGFTVAPISDMKIIEEAMEKPEVTVCSCRPNTDMYNVTIAKCAKCHKEIKTVRTN